MDELNVKFLKGVAYAFVQETIDFIWGDFDPVPGIFFMSLPVLVAGAILFWDWATCMYCESLWTQYFTKCLGEFCQSPGPHCKFTTGRQNQGRSRLSTNHRRRWRDRSWPVLECIAPQIYIFSALGDKCELSRSWDPEVKGRGHVQTIYGQKRRRQYTLMVPHEVPSSFLQDEVKTAKFRLGASHISTDYMCTGWKGQSSILQMH